MAKHNKFYVVWKGKTTGIFTTWEQCKQAVTGYDDAQYKSFDTETEAKRAFNHRSLYSYNASQQKTSAITQIKPSFQSNQLPILNAIATDAACSGNPGLMEYRGVHIASGKQIFHYKYPYGTNNIGEFLGVVHALSYLKRNNLNMPIYTDSNNAMKWVREKKCKTKLVRNQRTEALFCYIERAENWLKTNTYTTPILKWETEQWGEIPADFGRK
ncbi:MAG: ribonuclease H family protein [Bacteroidales bacterium]|jgi:ribonuclease HI|nr:ribonuclease H family protein [Bacteroidales bacterium]